MKKQTDNLDEDVYIRVTFKIKRGAINKLIEFLKQNTKTFQYWWIEGEKKDEPQQATTDGI